MACWLPRDCPALGVGLTEMDLPKRAFQINNCRKVAVIGKPVQYKEGVTFTEPLTKCPSSVSKVGHFLGQLPAANTLDSHYTRR